MNHPKQPPTAFGVHMQQSPTEKYGQQNVEVWPAGDRGSRPLIDLSPNGELWRISVVGDLVLSLSWGTSGRRVLTLDAPLCADLPGYVNVTAKPRTGDGATGMVSVTRSSGLGPQEMRRIVTVAAALPADATRFVAFVAATVSIRGTNVVLAASQSIPLVSGSALVSGSGFVEFTP